MPDICKVWLYGDQGDFQKIWNPHKNLKNWTGRFWQIFYDRGIFGCSPLHTSALCIEFYSGAFLEFNKATSYWQKLLIPGKEY